jgi:hypothetical protein
MLRIAPLCVLLVASCGAPPPRAIAPPPVGTRPPPRLGALALLRSPAPMPPLPRAIAPEPLSRAARLAPCRVVLEHRFASYGPHDEVTWTTKRTVVHTLVRDWEDARADIDWEKTPIAPIPLSLEQARALGHAQDSEVVRIGDRPSVVLLLADSSMLYQLDDRGRTVMVDWDPAADPGVYRFHYAYECAGTRVDTPRWADDHR